MNTQNIIKSINSIDIYDWEEALFNLELIDDYGEFDPLELVKKIVDFLAENQLSMIEFNGIIAHYSKRDYNQ